MSALQFPIDLTFRITTLSNDFIATDAQGQTLAYVRQKMFKLKEAVQVFTDKSRSDLLYTIKADKWIDFSTAYSFQAASGQELGKIARKGWKSLWKATYEIIDENEQLQYHVNEENGWVKVMDSFFGELPIIGIFTGYIFNPTYLVSTTSGEVVAKLRKQPSFTGRKLQIEKTGEMSPQDGQRILLGLMMMVLLERRRG